MLARGRRLLHLRPWPWPWPTSAREQTPVPQARDSTACLSVAAYHQTSRRRPRQCQTTVPQSAYFGQRTPSGPTCWPGNGPTSCLTSWPTGPTYGCGLSPPSSAACRTSSMLRWPSWCARRWHHSHTHPGLLLCHVWDWLSCNPGCTRSGTANAPRLANNGQVPRHASRTTVHRHSYPLNRHEQLRQGASLSSAQTRSLRDAVQSLERRGAVAITGDCGAWGRLQQKATECTALPVALTPLLQAYHLGTTALTAGGLTLPRASSCAVCCSKLCCMLHQVVLCGTRCPPVAQRGAAYCMFI